MSNFGDLPAGHLVQSTIAPKLLRITAERFLADKIQCIVERSEGRDLVDVAALLRRYPALTTEAKLLLKSQDALVLSERLAAGRGRSMKRTVTFARSLGTVRFEAAPGKAYSIPLFPGILKHAAPGELAELLSSAAAVRKYTLEALRTAASAGVSSRH